MATTYTYYIDGEEVSQRAAKKFYDEACEQAERYCASRGFPSPFVEWHLPHSTSRSALWASRNTKLGIEAIHNITAIHDRGGLEVIREED